MNIAILGGRFDPPHIGHLLIAQQVLDFRKDIDQVLLVPASKHQWKPAAADSTDRLAMVKMLAGERIDVSDIEIQRGGISYTIDTIRAVKKEKGANIFWIVGSDILDEFGRWEKAAELVDEAQFLVFPRDPYALPESLPKGFSVISNPSLVTTNVSSTIVRERSKQGLSIRGMVVDDVMQYIKEHSLYQ